MKPDIVGGPSEINRKINKVVPLGNVTRLDIPADKVLHGAVGKLESVVILGQQEDGEWYFASSVADGGTVLWMMEKLKLRLMDVE